MDMISQAPVTGGPLWDFVTVLVIAFTLAAIVRLLRDKQ
jgi:hypothetical protein